MEKSLSKRLGSQTSPEILPLVRRLRNQYVPRLALTCAAIQSFACATRFPAPLTPVPGALNRSAEYAIIDGQDTLALELVTLCPERIIADNDARRPLAHIHYEAEFGATGIPTVLSMQIWNNGAPVDGPPSQVARHIMVGDTALTQVWRGSQQQLQKSSADPRSFPMMSGYVGLFSQLSRVLRSQGAGAAVPVFYVGSGGSKGVASVRQQLPDSLIIRLDSTEFRTGWDKGNDFTGGEISGSAYRIVRTSLRLPSFANGRCNSPKLAPPKVVARAKTVAVIDTATPGL